MPAQHSDQFSARPFAGIEWLLIALVGASLAVSLWGFTSLPESARVPINFNLAGEAKLTLGKVPGLLLMPLVQVALLVIGWLAPRHTEGAGEQNGPRIYRVTFAAVTALLSFAHLLMVLTAAGRTLPVVPLLLTALVICAVVVTALLRFTRRDS